MVESWRGRLAALVALAACPGAAVALTGCSGSTDGTAASESPGAISSDGGSLGGACDGSIEFRGVRYGPVGGSAVEALPERPRSGRYLGRGTRLPCDDTPDDGETAPEAMPVKVYAIVGVPPTRAVMAGEGREPMGAVD